MSVNKERYHINLIVTAASNAAPAGPSRSGRGRSSSSETSTRMQGREAPSRTVAPPRPTPGKRP